MDVDDDARTIGRRLRRIRESRGKSLRVLADLSGVLSAASLSRIENGLRALDRRSEIVALANVLQIAPSELTKLPMPAPENGDADGAVIAVRQALISVSRNRPGGQVVPVNALRTRVRELLVVAQRQCRASRGRRRATSVDPGPAHLDRGRSGRGGIARAGCAVAHAGQPCMVAGHGRHGGTALTGRVGGPPGRRASRRPDHDGPCGVG